MLQITNQLLVAEAEVRGWKYEILHEDEGLIRYTLPSGREVLLKSCLTPFTSAVAYRIAIAKKAMYAVAKELEVTCPDTVSADDEMAVKNLLNTHQTVIVKPTDSSHGNGVTINLTTWEDVVNATTIAKKFSQNAIAQQQVSGDDYRLLFIDYKLAAACIRKPASVEGDGAHTVLELIRQENTSPDRAPEYRAKRNLIDEAAARRFLGTRIDEIPTKGERLVVVGTANIGTGGECIDVTNRLPEAMVKDGLKIAKSLAMPVVAVDFMGDQNAYWLLEINSTPSFGLHVYPSEGQSQPVHKIFMDWLQNA